MLVMGVKLDLVRGQGADESMRT